MRGQANLQRNGGEAHGVVQQLDPVGPCAAEGGGGHTLEDEAVAVQAVGVGAHTTGEQCAGDLCNVICAGGVVAGCQWWGWAPEVK